MWGMAAGDGDANGQVNIGDKTDVWSPDATTNGYLEGDYNLNGEVNNPDKNDYYCRTSVRNARYRIKKVSICRK